MRLHLSDIADGWLARLIALIGVFGLLQGLTGVMLGFYYRPGVQASHETVFAIQEDYAFGFWVRGIHSWNTDLLVVLGLSLVLVLFRFRDEVRSFAGLWLTSHFLLFLLTSTAFLGYVLPWDQRAFAAFVSGVGVLEGVPIVGGVLAFILRGESPPGDVTLARLDTLHTAVMPLFSVLTFQGLLALCFWPRESDSSLDLRTWAVGTFWWAFGLFHGVVFLGGLLDPDLGAPADALSPTPGDVKPEWYFLPTYQLVRMLPARLGPITGNGIAATLSLLLVGVWVLLPLLRLPRKQIDRIALGVGGVILVLGLLGWV